MPITALILADDNEEEAWVMHHELGHDIGLSHTLGLSVMGPETVSPSYSELDIFTLNAVYGAGLGAGSTRAQFKAADLIR